ncbi:hypothetical protein BC834DRAFT_629586 [Gloeopeniophorella convolvens]|nr:hypothetical protein BC834DRAFT_629586 [Gloeopeniophorella convolvens]
MPSATLSEQDSLFHQLQRRMVESGEWDRLVLQLRYQLNDAGWLDSQRVQTLEQAHTMEQPSFRELLDGTRTRAHGVPEAVRQQIMTSMRAFIDKQIES